MALPTLTVEERKRLAQRVGIVDQYIYLLMRGLKKPSPAVARRLHEADPRFRLQDLRPDDYSEIWPELEGND